MDARMSPRSLLLALMAIAVSAVQAEPVTWPQQLDTENGATVTIYQPQVEEFSGNSLEGRAAVSVKTAESGDVPVFGAIWFRARLDTDRSTRTAVIRDVTVEDVRFADATEGQMQQLADFIEAELGTASLTISVDQLLADLDSADAVSSQANLKHEPPEIILYTEPALLVSIDGEPVFRDIEGSTYERVVNTPYLIARGGRDLYLYVGSNTWYHARSVSGPWERASRVPGEVEKLVEPAEEDAEAVEDVKIVVATKPTELVVADGAPSWSPVEGMNLLYMDNTDSDVFLELSTQSYYVLLSGRWYRGTGMQGDIEWANVPNDELPEPFSDIPEGSVNGSVLSHVAGTEQARAAVLDNTIPQTAAIKRDDTSFSVDYDGTPDFAPIEDIRVEYAQNTSAAVFRYANLYYACDDGVWYVANSATGPWSVATEIPDAIYKIPASNPHHNVTYVKVYDVTPTVVYTGYTPGYYGSYYYSGAVVYGTGWYYNPWYGPYYYPRYPTWGFHLHYNPWYGWSFGVSWMSGPFRFTFGTHGGWWGVGGYRPYPRPVVYGGYRKTNININVDNSINIGGGNRTRPENRPNLYDRPENRLRNAERPASPSDRRARPATGNIQNNVLTDRAGNVYQRDANGAWQQRNKGQWQSPQNLDRASPQVPATRPLQPSGARPSTGAVSDPRQRHAGSWSGGSATRPQLERDYSARQRGAQRTQNYQRQAAPRSRPARR
jgi:hypothetical protein